MGKLFKHLKYSESSVDGDLLHPQTIRLLCIGYLI